MMPDLSDDSLAELANFPNLKETRFEPRSISPKGLLNLPALKNLERLTLLSHDISPALIEQLDAMPKLKVITVMEGTETNTYSTTLDEAIEYLREELPGKTIRKGKGIEGAGIEDAGIEDAGIEDADQNGDAIE